MTSSPSTNPFAELIAAVRGTRLDPSFAAGASRLPKLQSFSGLSTLARLNRADTSEASLAQQRMFRPTLASRRPTTREQSAAINYSDEQRAVIECHDRRIVADAFAGCGKTTTAVGFCQARPNQRILYLVLNAANAAEARGRFTPNVSAMTTHSLAWNSPGMRAHIGSRLDRRWRAMTLMQQFRISSAVEAFHAQQVLQAFFASTDTDIGDKHVAALAQQRNLSYSHSMQAVANARLIWKAICNRSHRCSIPDDAYLKMFALSKPQLDFDTIILDEAQDANAVTAQIVAAQQRAKLLCIGDRHQAIYGFRGSVNAMEKFSIGASRFALTQTYRFGPAIAKVANTILGQLKGEQNKIRGMGFDGKWDHRRITYLSRTNAELFSLAAERRGLGMFWVGRIGLDGYQVGRDGPDNYRLSLLTDVYHLWARQVGMVQDRNLRQMESFEDYRSYGEAARDGEVRVLCKLVETFGHDTPALIDDIRNNASHHEDDADIVVTTAHKSKGLEWDCVRICDDFEFLQDVQAHLSNLPGVPLPQQKLQDINLLYVAATRAKKALSLNEETANWLKQLDAQLESQSDEQADPVAEFATPPAAPRC